MASGLQVICTIEDCERERYARGWCNKHYLRWWKHGDPNMMLPNLGNRAPREIPEIRTCTECGKTGPRDEFARNRNLCKPCRTAYARQWAIANPERRAASRARSAANRVDIEKRRKAIRLGIDPDLVEAYRADHHGACDICGGVPDVRDLAIDHDHVTGAFRGMLCTNCNNGLGRFRDDPKVLARAIEYLRVSPADLWRRDYH